MIFPENTTPPPAEPTLPVMGFMVVPSLWAMGQDRISAWQQARCDLARDLRQLYTLPCFNSRHWLQEFELCNVCAGVCVFRDLMQPIPHHAAQVLDFFFGRDGGEAMVYEWQPFEKNFRLVNRDWLLARRV